MTLVAMAVLAGCGGSSKSGGGGSTGSSGSSGPAAVKVVKVAGFGSALTTSSGQSLYLLSTDPSGSSKCSGTCTQTWKPLTVSGSPSAGPGAQQSLLSSFKRTDGTTQVLYDKHALYTHVGTGATSGEGVASDGGVWYLVSPSGSAIKSTSAGGY